MKSKPTYKISNIMENNIETESSLSITKKIRYIEKFNNSNISCYYSHIFKFIIYSKNAIENLTNLL